MIVVDQQNVADLLKIRKQLKVRYQLRVVLILLVLPHLIDESKHAELYLRNKDVLRNFNSDYCNLTTKCAFQSNNIEVLFLYNWHDNILNLSGLEMDDVEFGDNLKKVNLEGTKDVPAIFMKGLLSHPNIEYLDLSNINFSDLNISDLSLGAKLKWVALNGATNVPYKLIEGLLSHPNIEHLNLINLNFSDLDISSLSLGDKLNSVKLSGAKIYLETSKRFIKPS